MSIGDIRRGDIYWVDLGPISDSSSRPSKRRPVLVVQSDAFNRSRISTVIVAAITSSTALARHPGNVFMPVSVTGLPKDSVCNVTSLATIDKIDLVDYVGRVPLSTMAEVAEGLCLALDTAQGWRV